MYKQRSQSQLSLSLLRAGALFSSCLWIDVPSRLEDGFSCYLLNKTAVTLSCNTDLCKSYNWSIRDLRAITWSIQDLRAVTRQGGFNVRPSKSVL